MALPEYEQIARFDRSKTSAFSTNLPVVEEADASESESNPGSAL